MRLRLDPAVKNLQGLRHSHTFVCFINLLLGIRKYNRISITNYIISV